MYKKITLALVLLVVCRPAGAQVRTILPNGGDVSGAGISGYSAEWRMVFTGADGESRVIGQWLDTVTAVTRDGIELLRRAQVSFDSVRGTSNRQVHTLERATMSPVSSHSFSGSRFMHTDFRSDQVRAVMIVSEEVAALHADASDLRPAFDFGIAGLLLVGMGIQPGDSVAFPNYEIVPTGFSNRLPAGIEIVTKETTVVADNRLRPFAAGSLGTVEALQLSVQLGSRELVFWLIEQPPYIVGLTSGTTAGSTTWELLGWSSQP